MDNFYEYSMRLEAVKPSSVTIDPRFEALIKELLSDTSLGLKSKADVMRFVYDAVAGGDRQKLQRLLQVRQPDLADLVRSLTQVGKVVNLSPDVHQAFMQAGLQPEEILNITHDALIKGNPESLQSLLQELGRGVHSEEQKQAVAQALGHVVELRRNWKLKDLINRWLTHDEEQSSSFGGPKPRTNFELSREDFTALSELLSKAVVRGGRPAILQAIGQWVKQEPRILNSIVGELPKTAKNVAQRPNDAGSIQPEEVGESEQELVEKVYEILEKYGEIKRAYVAARSQMSRRNFLKMGATFLLGGATMAAINALVRSASGNPQDDANRARQEIESSHKYAPYTLDFASGRNATYRYDPRGKTLSVRVTPVEEGNQIRLARKLITYVQNLGYKVQGQPQISEEGDSTIITVPNVTDPGTAQPLNQLVKFARRGMKVDWTTFGDWHRSRVLF